MTAGASVLCRTADCLRAPVIVLSGMCEHEHMTENAYCDEHAAFLLGVSETVGFLCTECRPAYGQEARPWHHDCPLTRPLRQSAAWPELVP
jgi:hypothetical protein